MPVVKEDANLKTTNVYAQDPLDEHPHRRKKRNRIIGVFPWKIHGRQGAWILANKIIRAKSPK